MSGVFKLNLADLLRGLITAVLTASLTALQQFFSTTGTMTPINWKLVGGVAAATAIGYLLKNLLTDNTGKVMGIAATAGPPPAHEDDLATIAAANPLRPASPPPLHPTMTDEELMALLQKRMAKPMQKPVSGERKGATG
jgi:hypothetical protein